MWTKPLCSDTNSNKKISFHINILIFLLFDRAWEIKGNQLNVIKEVFYRETWCYIIKFKFFPSLIQSNQKHAGQNLAIFRKFKRYVYLLAQGHNSDKTEILTFFLLIKIFQSPFTTLMCNFMNRKLLKVSFLKIP